MITFEDLKHLPAEALAHRYYKIAVITAPKFREASRRSVRAHPYPGQGLPENLYVECSESFRINNPIGTVFVLWAKLTYNKINKAYFLYSYFGWKTQIVTREKAEKLIKNGSIGIHSHYAYTGDLEI